MGDSVKLASLFNDPKVKFRKVTVNAYFERIMEWHGRRK